MSSERPQREEDVTKAALFAYIIDLEKEEQWGVRSETAPADESSPQ
jgi:hypothetical protein